MAIGLPKLYEEERSFVLKAEQKEKKVREKIKRLKASPIETFGDLEKHLKKLKGPLFSDMNALRRVRARKSRLNVA